MQKVCLEGQITPCWSQLLMHSHTSPCNCLSIVWLGRYMGLSMVVGIVWVIWSQYPRSSSCNEKTSWLSYIISRNMDCYSLSNGASSQHSRGMGDTSSACKLKSGEWLLVWQPKTGWLDIFSGSSEPQMSFNGHWFLIRMDQYQLMFGVGRWS